MNTKKYDGMGIFQEAKQREIDGTGYHSTRFKTIWKSKNCDWNHLTATWGIRYSDQWQLFPIWNVSDNCKRAVMFGLWKLHITISYSRATSFNHNRKLLFRRRLWRIYLLFC